MSTPLWQPSRAAIEATQMHALMQRINREHGQSLDDYADLHTWSVDHLETFWPMVWELGEVIAEQRGNTVLSRPDAMPGARWFPEARLNFAENLLRRRDDKPALVMRDERERRRVLSYAELYEQVARLAHALRASGVTPGDRVAGFVPNSEHAIIGMLAAASLGAVWSSCSPDFGFNGVLDRFGQIQPKVLIATDGYTWNGKHIDTRERVGEISRAIDSLNQVVVFPFLNDTPDTRGIDKAVTWENYLDNEARTLEFEALPFDHPLYILFSSGTTGAPKCIVHSAGGSLLQHIKEHRLHTDLSRDDVLFYYTTCGWMMWNWQASVLMTGASVITVDGSPGYPDLNFLWDTVAAERVTHFGTSARFIAGCRKAELRPARSLDQSHLRTLFSTGSPLLPEDYDWVYSDGAPDALLGSIAGGTDICGCFVGSTPLLPVRRGEIQCRFLGVDVMAYSEDGQPMTEGRGELVCRQPLPSMPVRFWNDPEGERYRDAYFSTFPGVWAHGDFIEFTEHGGAIIHGRSDATLNPGGVRIGTAEIYRQVETVAEVKDSLVVGRQIDGDVEVMLLVVPADGQHLTDDLARQLRGRIREGASPRHVPKHIIEVPDIPYTRSGKKVELAVARLVNGSSKADNRDALGNPEALDRIREQLTEAGLLPE